MADKKISDLTEASSIAATDWLLIETSGGNSRKIKAKVIGAPHRGALVKKAADQTGADYTTQTAISWDNEGTGCYDTDAIHDTVTDNSRVTVPAGVSYVRVGYNVRISAGTADTWWFSAIAKNGSTEFVGGAGDISEGGLTTMRQSAWTPVIPVTPGDYFQVLLQTESDNSSNVEHESSWLAMEIIE